MKHLKSTQTGGSAVMTIIILAAIGYGIFFGIQYIPLKIESTTVDSVLESLSSSQQMDSAADIPSVEAAIIRLLNINQLDDLKSAFNVRQSGSELIVEVSYDRQINLLFDEKTLHYEKAITLKSGKQR